MTTLIHQIPKNNYTTTQFYLLLNINMEDTKYCENREYAAKYTIPVNEDTKVANVELYDKIWKWFVDVSNLEAKELVSLLSDIEITGASIDEARFSEVTK